MGKKRASSHVGGRWWPQCVVVIDVDPQRFAALGPEFSGFRLEGDATELDVLKKAKADKAHQLIAVTRNDNVNLAVAQMGKPIFRVRRVVARVSDPQRENIFRDLGIQTVCPLTLAAGQLLAESAGSPRRPERGPQP